jgi:hypothetical protein
VSTSGSDKCTACRQQGIGKPEDAEAFKARIQQLIDRYEAQYLPRKQRKVTQDQIREVDEGARPLGLTSTVEANPGVLSSCSWLDTFTGPSLHEAHDQRSVSCRC